MKIYTSYFANIKNLLKENIVPIGICCIPPKWFNGPNLASVAPTKSILFECKEDHELYEKRFRAEVLSLYKDPNVLINTLQFLSHGNDIALCCYETPNDFCHRHIVANWLNEQLNLDVKEFPTKYEQKMNPLF